MKLPRLPRYDAPRLVRPNYRHSGIIVGSVLADAAEVALEMKSGHTGAASTIACALKSGDNGIHIALFPVAGLILWITRSEIVSVG